MVQPERGGGEFYTKCFLNQSLSDFREKTGLHRKKWTGSFEKKKEMLNREGCLGIMAINAAEW